MFSTSVVCVAAYSSAQIKSGNRWRRGIIGDEQFSTDSARMCKTQLPEEKLGQVFSKPCRLLAGSIEDKNSFYFKSRLCFTQDLN